MFPLIHPSQCLCISFSSTNSFLDSLQRSPCRTPCLHISSPPILRVISWDFFYKIVIITTIIITTMIIKFALYLRDSKDFSLLPKCSLNFSLTHRIYNRALNFLFLHLLLLLCTLINTRIKPHKPLHCFRKMPAFYMLLSLYILPSVQNISSTLFYWHSVFPLWLLTRHTVYL